MYHYFSLTRQKRCLNIFYGFVPGYDYGVSLRPMWDFKNEKLIGSISASNTMYDFSSFFTSILRFDANQNAGRKGVHIEFEGKRKKHLERYPVWATTFNIDYHDITNNAVDSTYYRTGEIAVAYTELELHNRPNPFLSYYLRTGIKTGIQNSQFLRFHMQTNFYYKFTKKYKAKLRIWAGGFLDTTDLPNQYLTYLSSNIDPDFRNGYIFNRTPDINDISIGIRQYDIGGPAMHGLILENDKIKGINKWLISANFEISVPKLPAKLFMDYAIIEGDENYFDLGLKKSFGPLMIILPLYQNWDDPSMINDKNWLAQRMRFSLSVSSFNFRDMF